MKPEPLNGKVYISNADEEDLELATKENVKRYIDTIGEKPLFILKLDDVRGMCLYCLNEIKRIVRENTDEYGEILLEIGDFEWMIENVFHKALHWELKEENEED